LEKKKNLTTNQQPVLEIDPRGFPVLKGKKPTSYPSKPQGVDPQEWARRQDAVRAAAREMEPLAHGDVSELLQGAVQRPLDPHEVDQFVNDVRDSKLDHLVDWMDNNLRKSSVLGFQRRRIVKVTPPKGWIKKTIGGLSDDEILNVVSRLEARGLDKTQIGDNLKGRFGTARQERLSKLLD
jgi:hypothetical protein